MAEQFSPEPVRDGGEPLLVELGDAAGLTLGGDSDTNENKREIYE